MHDFTLIVPTHNRHHYLARSIEYYNALNAKVIYCDSTVKPYEGTIHSNMEYLHLPDKKFAEKVLVALEKITTPFVATCADDDFILIEALNSGFETLKNNEKYRTVVGKYIAFDEIFSGDFYQRYASVPEDISLSPQKNAEYFFQNYYQILWGMYDKNILLKAYKIINQANFNNDNFIEIVIGACACHGGGIKFLDEIWGVREVSIQEHWGNRHVPLNLVVNLKEEADYHSFTALVNENTADGYADLVLGAYLSGQVVVQQSSAKKLIPAPIKSALRKFKNRLFPVKKPALVLSPKEESNLRPLKSILTIKSDVIQD